MRFATPVVSIRLRRTSSTSVALKQGTFFSSASFLLSGCQQARDVMAQYADFRERAEECMQFEKLARTVHDRQFFHDMAMAWLGRKTEAQLPSENGRASIRNVPRHRRRYH